MQKTLLLVLTIIGSALVSRAQVEKNDWLLGGTFSFGTNNYSNPNSTSSNSNLNPELGWAITNNSVIGLRGGFSTGTSKDNASNKSVYTGYSAGLFWKKFFAINEKVGWYGNLSGAYTYAKNKYTNSTGSTSKDGVNGFNANLSPGVYYKPAKKVFLNASIGGLSYSHSKTNPDASLGVGSNTANSFNLNLLNYFSFGVSFIISKDHQM